MNKDITIKNQCFFRIQVIINDQSFEVPPRSSAVFSVYKPRKIKTYLFIPFLYARRTKDVGAGEHLLDKETFVVRHSVLAKSFLFALFVFLSLGVLNRKFMSDDTLFKAISLIVVLIVSLLFSVTVKSADD